MVYTQLIFYACLELRFPDLETNPGPGVLFLVPAEYSAEMCGAFRGTWETWQWLRLSTIYRCALRPWSRTDVVYQSCWSLDLVVLSCCAEIGCLGLVGWLQMCEMDMGHFANPNLRLCVVLSRQYFYVFSLYRITDLNDLIYQCFLTAMAAVQAVDVRASFLFMGDLNGRHQG